MASLEDRSRHMEDCSRCNNCKWTPVVRSERFASICPSAGYGRFHSYTGGGKLINGFGLLKGTVQYSESLTETIYTCSMCGGCDVACKTNFSDLIEPLDSLYAIRERMVRDGQAPLALQKLLGQLREHGNALGTSPQVRGQWCADLQVKRTPHQTAAVLLHVGDAAFDQAQWPQLRFVISELQRQGVDVVIGGAEEPDCGALAFEIGDRELATQLANATVAWIRSSQARQVITCSDTDFAAFRSLYPRMDVSLDGIEVLHVSQWLAKRISTVSQTTSHPGEEVVTYHDACHLGRLSEPFQPWKGEWVMKLNSLPARQPDGVMRFGVGGVYDEPRQVLAASGARIVEMERIREFSYCCGAGGGGKEANPDFAAFAGRERLEEALATGAKTLVSSCSGCINHLNEVVQKHDIPIRVIGLLDYLLSRQKVAVGTNATTKE